MARRLPTDKKKRNLVILAIQRAIESTFDSSDWKALGYLTGTDDWVQSHPRLLRSLSWGDADYPGNVLDAIEHILEEDAANLDALVDHPKINEWLSANERTVLSDLEGLSAAVPQPALKVSTDTVSRALGDAEVLIKTSGPTSAVDRIHTALHGYMIALCNAAGIAYTPSPSLMELFKVLRKHHPGLQTSTAGQTQISHVLNSLANIVHVMNEIRNQASVAHPNPSLIGSEEATLVINSARTLFSYLNDKCT